MDDEVVQEIVDGLDHDTAWNYTYELIECYDASAFDTIRTLIGAGCEPDVLLAGAASDDNREIVSLLLAAGASVSDAADALAMAGDATRSQLQAYIDQRRRRKRARLQRRGIIAFRTHRRRARGTHWLEQKGGSAPLTMDPWTLDHTAAFRRAVDDDDHDGVRCMLHAVPDRVLYTAFIAVLTARRLTMLTMLPVLLSAPSPRMPDLIASVAGRFYAYDAHTDLVYEIIRCGAGERTLRAALKIGFQSEFDDIVKELYKCGATLDPGGLDDVMPDDMLFTASPRFSLAYAIIEAGDDTPRFHDIMQKDLAGHGSSILLEILQPALERNNVPAMQALIACGANVAGPSALLEDALVNHITQASAAVLVDAGAVLPHDTTVLKRLVDARHIAALRFVCDAPGIVPLKVVHEAAEHAAETKESVAEAVLRHQLFRKGWCSALPAAAASGESKAACQERGVPDAAAAAAVGTTPH
jgi:hypothetical protein